VTISAPNIRDVLGALDSWTDGLHLWDELTREGYLSASGNDFVSFCNMQVALPMHCCKSGESGFDEMVQFLTNVATFGLVKKLARYYLYAEDPDADTRVPVERIYFDEAKSLPDILQLYQKQLSTHSQYQFTQKKLTTTLNNTKQQSLNEKYIPVVFESIEQVEHIYPVYALRNIYLQSWKLPNGRFGFGDFDWVFDLVSRSVSISKSEKSKLKIERRGKFQNYSEYEGRGGYKERFQELHAGKNASRALNNATRDFSMNSRLYY